MDPRGQRGKGTGLPRRILGGLLSVIGMVVLLFAVIDAFAGSAGNPIENATTAHAVALVVGGVLVTLGSYLSRRYRMVVGLAGMNGSHHPNSPEAVLRRNDFNIPPEPRDDEPTFEYDDGAVYVRCQQCGTRNEQEFSYCGNCSTQLPS